MKHYISFCIFICSIQLYSQENTYDVTNYVYPPEEAFQFTRYGDIMFNESSGTLNLSVPLLEYKVQDLTIPISLSYVGNGVKVNQNPNNVGMNWRLDATGVITRVVNGNADETTQGHYFSAMDLDAMDLQNDSNDTAFLSQILTSDGFDTQRDRFDFSFFGHSGSFYLDGLEPKLVDKSSNLKIEIIGNLSIDRSFVITTPEGVKYYFGGEEYAQSYIKNTSHQLLHTGETTVFYLYKIESLTGANIFFEYVDSYKKELSSFQQVIQYQDPNRIVESLGTCEFYEAFPDFDFVTVGSPVLGKKIINHTYGKRLVEIHSNNGHPYKKIIFNESGFAPSLSQLDRIQYKMGSGIVKQIDFNYLEPTDEGNSKRFFLERVVINDHINGNGKQVYKMDYKDPIGLPDQFSFNQDFHGYYNGASNNTFIPKNDHYFFSRPEQNLNLADRNLNFDLATKGVLTKIHYPTGGYSHFEYEAPRVKETVYEDVDLRIYHKLFQGSTQLSKFIDQHWTLGEITIDPDPDPLVNGIFGDYTTEFQIEINLQPGYFEKHTKIYLKVEDLTTSQSNIHFFALNLIDSNFNEPKTILHTSTHDLEDGHQYKFSLGFNTQSGLIPSSWAPIDVKARFKYPKGEEEIDGFGIRLKRTTAYSKENTPTNIRRYYYKRAKHIGELGMETPYRQPTVKGMANSMLRSETQLAPCYPISPLDDQITCIDGYRVYDYLKYDAGLNGNSYETNLLYKFVTISHGGDDFENGGVEKEFYLTGSANFQEYNVPNPTYLGPVGFRKMGGSTNAFGKMLAEKTIRKAKDGSLEIANERRLEYDFGVQEFLSNFVGKREKTCSTFLDYDNIYIGTYNVNTYNNHLLRQTMTDYIDPLPLDGDESEVRKIVTNINYEYGDLAGLPIEISTTKSNGLQQITKMIYPDLIVNSSVLNMQPDLTSMEYEAIDKLKTTNQHRISTPIQVETYKKGGDSPEVLLSAQRHLYKTFDNGFTQKLRISSSKNGSGFEDRVIFHRYDAKGNPVEISKSDGTTVVYIWSTKHKMPLAKIENATYDEVYDSIGNLREALPNAQVFTYTYTPDLYLMSSVTDPRGYVMYYEYDAFNRLEHVKDKDGNILSKNQYNYATQN